MESKAYLLKINEKDNVAVALTDMSEGCAFEGVTAVQDIPRGHKLCLEEIPENGYIIKYGSPIGHATRTIHKGEWIHSHNMKTNLEGTLDYEYHPHSVELPTRAPGTFQGYERSDGSIGIRNEIWVVPTVGCVNTITAAIANQSQSFVKGSVEGVYAFPHPYGCSQLGDDLDYTRRALCGLIRHPNAGGVLVVGLGCENNQIDTMKELLGDYDPDRVKFLFCQEVEDEIVEGVAVVGQLAQYAARFQRKPVPMSKLVIGLKCGGSDGLSGITANPLVGALSDRIIAEGGTAILTEVPEMFGAETLLMNRCADEALFHQTVDLINDFKEYFIQHGQVIYENPSPGNKAGGITTLEEKSLGCTQKGGRAQVTGVLRYGEAVVRPGLHLLQSPGNDLVASTALTISGAHVVLFTTGRGTPFGAPAPTVKISSNTPLYQKKTAWIDFNAGEIAFGASIQDECEKFYRYVQDLASGVVRTKAETKGVREFTIFKDGVTE